MPQRPVLPWQLLSNNVFVGMLRSVFSLKQDKYHLLTLLLSNSFTAVSPLGSSTASLIHKRTKFVSITVLLAAVALQVVGSSLPFILAVHTDGSARIIPSAQYRYKLLLGFGLGTSISTLFLTVWPNIERRYISTYPWLPDSPKFFLGGTTGLAVVTSVMTKSINSDLAEYLSSEQIYRVLQSAAAIEELPTPPRSNEIRIWQRVQ
ncbi:hypothetical protein BHYA_0174g00050 [Botrytis hyacinthi]|uniref:Uncharacterized protein n=1 Tax=Botrytis hyacinthi TaxID=278943 RepID=A0A4Z1GE13_9HELO|nr:hypothetical protein BHYA_0174g00050 [Botrytis hyacinthi]